MVILTNLRYYVLGLFLLLVNTGIYGIANYQFKADTIRVTFSHAGGYVPYIAVACYVSQNEVYQLQTIQTHKSSGLQLPKTIGKGVVTKLLSDCSSYSAEDECEFTTITKDDYCKYTKILKDRDSLLFYFPMLEFPTFSQEFNKEHYELDEQEFLSLSCSDIIQIADFHIPRLFVPSLPLLRIELVDSYGETITIEPKRYYKGTAWGILSQGKETYINFECVMSFLRGIQFDRYACFLEKFYLLFQIAESIQNNKYQRQVTKASNNRELVTATGITHQVTNYYPFGAPYADPAAVSSADRQPYKYNGKELDKMHGLNTYDYGARQYYSVLPIWDRVDPLAEDNYHVSPYVYCLGNPVTNIDNDGKKVKPVHITSHRVTYFHSPAKFRQAMMTFGRTSFGHQLLSDFYPKGKTIFGVQGNGKYADFDLVLYEFDYDSTNGEQTAKLFDGEKVLNGQTQLISKNGKPQFNIIIDAQLSQDELIEAICHEFCIHLSIYEKVLDAYLKEGEYLEALKVWNSESEEMQHNDIKNREKGKLLGTKNYLRTLRELKL